MPPPPSDFKSFTTADTRSDPASEPATPKQPAAYPNPFKQPANSSSNTPRFTNAPTFGFPARKNTSGVKPRCRPFFAGKYSPENDIRGYNAAGDEMSGCSAHPPSGRKVTQAWLDAGLGWTTTHFDDIEPYDAALQQVGSHRCRHKAPNGSQCEFVAEGSSCCKDTCCWCPCGGAAERMADHIITVHHMSPSPNREWATGLCQCGEGGCCEALCCTPCQYSRQVMATHGHADTFNACLCVKGVIPCFCHAPFGGFFPFSCGSCGMAWKSRHRTVVLNRIDETGCATCCIAHCCPLCSVMQTHRELIAAQVDPGGVCGSQARYGLGRTVL